MALLLKIGRLLDPSRSLDATLDLRIENGRVSQIGLALEASGSDTLDLRGLVVAPGFIDMHVHLREPGKEEAETILTGTRAAAAGGFTAVACMPNTSPVNDSVSMTDFILHRAAETARVKVYPIAAVTEKQLGETLAPMEELKGAGVVAFSDDGRPVVNSLLMRQALERAAALDLPVIDHCEDPNLFRGGAMHEGKVSSRLAIRGIPGAAEEIMVARNIILSKMTGAQVHMAHMSTAGSMQLIRRAKQDGIRVTAEVTPHHFALTDEAVARYGTNAKMNPPLRTALDVDAMLEAIADGTVDVIASDHAPHHEQTKNVEFHDAAFGIVGLETSVSLGLDRLVHSEVISLARFVELYSINPARILHMERGIYEGAEANLTIFHPTRQVTIRAEEFQSKSQNTPFDGWTLHGAPAHTICKGELIWGK
ncbi:MAG TPA: dihydroorotase [Acidobacteriota bacterium]|nr:dihydroorotase [Acidobacteriota bacterium]